MTKRAYMAAEQEIEGFDLIGIFLAFKRVAEAPCSRIQTKILNWAKGARASILIECRMIGVGKSRYHSVYRFEIGANWTLDVLA